MNNKTKKPHWIKFYAELTALYDWLLNDESGISRTLYSSKTNYLLAENTINKRYRAVLHIDESDKVMIAKQMDRVEALFRNAVAIDNKEFGTDRKPKLPVYMPYFLDNEDGLFKIQIHENKAHSSVNHKQGDMIPIASCPRGQMKSTNKNDNAHSNEQILLDAAELLEADGYTVEIEDDPETPYLMLSVDVATLCDKYECDSIQRRSLTGRQIRANFFTKQDGIIQKSKLATVGVLLLTKRAEVLHSLDRSIRTDAKYTKQHVDEIILDVISDVISTDLRSGRLYKRLDEVKP